MCGLDPARLHRPDRLQDNNKNHLVNILKVGGLAYADLSHMHACSFFTSQKSLKFLQVIVGDVFVASVLPSQVRENNVTATQIKK